MSHEDYAVLREKVLERDGYKCRVPGCMTPEFFIAPHHKIFRSHQGDDADYNLITLCQICHSNVHGYRLKVNGEHPDWTFEWKSGTIPSRDPTGET